MIVNRRQLAELFGVEQATLTAWAAEGLPVERKAQGRAWRADLAACISWLLERTRQEAAAGGPGAEVAVQRERLLRAQATAKETANRVRAGELIERLPAASEVMEAVLIARDRLLAIPGRTAPAVSAMTDIVAIEDLLTGEMEREMQLLSARAAAL